MVRRCKQAVTISSHFFPTSSTRGQPIQQVLLLFIPYFAREELPMLSKMLFSLSIEERTTHELMHKNHEEGTNSAYLVIEFSIHVISTIALLMSGDRTVSCALLNYDYANSLTRSINTIDASTYPLASSLLAHI